MVGAVCVVMNVVFPVSAWTGVHNEATATKNTKTILRKDMMRKRVIRLDQIKKRKREGRTKI